MGRFPRQPEQAATFGARLARSFNGSLSSLVSAAEALAVFIAGSAPWLALLVGATARFGKALPGNKCSLRSRHNWSANPNGVHCPAMPEKTHGRIAL